LQKPKRLPSAWWGVLLGTLTAVSAILCLSTGFSLEAGGTGIVLGCFAGALVGCLFTVFDLGALSFLVWAAAAALFWFYGQLNISLETLAATVSGYFANGYGTPVLRWSGDPLTDPTLALSLWGSLIAMAAGRCVTRGRGTLGASLISLSPLMVCMLLNDTVPNAFALFLLLANFLLVLIPQTVRRRDPWQASRLTALLLIPLVLAMAVLFLLNPRATYDKQSGAQKLQDAVVQAIAEGISPEEVISEAISDLNPVQGFRLPENLRLAGPRNFKNKPVMEVTAQETTTLYLRGRSCDTYTGTTWDTELPFHDSSFPTRGEALTLQVDTASRLDMLYLPYVSWTGLPDGCQENTDKLTSYRVSYSPLDIGGSATSEQDLSPYLQLPEDTYREAQNFLPADPGLGTWAYAQHIAAVVRGSAAYSLDTKAMPASEDDFALWFLSESDTGYCVHFASATAVLLRAAGIPARYVTGYLVTTLAGVPVQVLDKDAHAWVECYIEGTGWLILEPTPAASLEELPLPTGQIPQTTEPPRPTLPDFTLPELPDPTESTTEATSAIGGADGPTMPTLPTLRPLPGWVTALLWILLLAGATVGQWRLRLYLRQRRGAALQANALALHLWQQVEAHCRVRREEPPEALLTLAEKAKFSQYTTTEAEITELETWLQDSRKAFQSQPAYLQPVYTLVFALY